VIEPVFELGNFDLLVQFAKNNFGIACVMKNFIQDELEQGNVFEIKLFEQIPPRNACIVVLNGTDQSPAARELIKMLSNNC
jgi:DNA-binding transcriptional LysR family regulator